VAVVTRRRDASNYVAQFLHGHMALRQIVDQAITDAYGRNENCAACRFPACETAWKDLEDIRHTLHDEFSYTSRLVRMDDSDDSGKLNEFYVLRIGLDGDPDVRLHIEHAPPRMTPE